MNSVNITVYLFDDVVSGAIGTFQIVYFYSNTLITIGCQPIECPCVDNFTQLGILSIRYEESFGISHIIVECFLMSGSGGKLNKSIEMLLFVREE